MRKMAEKETNRNEDNLFSMGSSIGWGPRLMKRMSLVRISLPFLCGHVKKKKMKKILLYMHFNFSMYPYV